MAEQNQIVYVLTNAAMPGLVKIGFTTQAEIETRLKQLFSSGVPVPFECSFACKVKNAHEVEKALHFAFGDFRINQSREFFKIQPERVIAILKVISSEEVTSQVTKEIKADFKSGDLAAGDKLRRSRRPNMNFELMKIPEGSILVYVDDPTITVKVVGPKKVEYQGEVVSLTFATGKIMNLDTYQLQPSPYWLFENKTVQEIYEETFPEQEDAA